MTRRKVRTTNIPPEGKSTVSVSLTRTANETLNAIALRSGLSKSALLESVLTGSFSINNQGAEKVINLAINHVDDVENSQNHQVIDVIEADQNEPISSEKQQENHQSAEANEIVKREIERYQQQIEELEKNINKQQDLVVKITKENKLLEEELEKKNQQIEGKAKQEEDNNSNQTKEIESKLLTQEKTIKSLEDQLQQKQQLLEDTNEKLTKLKQDLLKQSNSDEDKIKDFNGKFEQKEQQIQELNHQLETLKTQINQYQNSEKSTQIKIDELGQKIEQLQEQLANQQQQKMQLQQNQTQIRQNQDNLFNENHQQRQLIHHLRQQITQLETLAVIGEQKLNKWRHKNYLN